MPMHRSLNHMFFSRWSPEMAYVLGYFAADGTMLKNNRGAHFIEFTSTDRILIDNLQKTVESNHRISERDRGGNCKTTYRIQIGSKRWFEDLTLIGFTQNKSLVLKFPSVPMCYLGDFVRGYFDGDGCVYLGKHWANDRNKYRWNFHTRFTSGSHKFLDDLKTHLRKCGIEKGHISPKSRGGYDLVLSWQDSLALYRLMYHTAEVANLFLPRKREKLERAIEVLGLDK
jgi:hypothetical protein